MTHPKLICNELDIDGRVYSITHFQTFLSENPEQKPLHLGFTLEQEPFEYCGFIPTFQFRPKKGSGTNKSDELLLYCRDTSRCLNRFDFSFKDTVKPLRHQQIINPTLRSLACIGVFAPLITIPSLGIYFFSYDAMGLRDNFNDILAIVYPLSMLGGAYLTLQEEKYRNRHDLIAYQKYKTFCDSNPLRTR